MPDLTLYRGLTRTHTQALVLAKLDAFYRTTKLAIDGVRWTAPKIDVLAAQLGVHKSTISRVIRWLADQGFILIRKDRWCRSPRLYIKVLFRFREKPVQLENQTPVQPQCNLTGTQDATCNLRPVITKIRKRLSAMVRGCAADALPVQVLSSAGSGEKGPRRRSLSPGVSGAQERAVERGKVAPGQGGPANEVAAFWNGILRRDGYKPFPVDPKSMAHIRNLDRRFTAIGSDLPTHIPRMIEHWLTFAPPDAGKTPHPWAAIRAFNAYCAYQDALKQAQSAGGSGNSVTTPTQAPVMAFPTQVPMLKKDHGPQLSLSQKLKAKWGTPDKGTSGE